MALPAKPFFNRLLFITTIARVLPTPLIEVVGRVHQNFRSPRVPVLGITAPGGF
jgi:hypothetical protein